MSPTVSVIVATYNYGQYLAEALTSILRQTFTDFEVIVIDDGSTDRTAAVVASFRAEPRLRYHRTEHLGQPRAENAGIRLARGPLLAFLDADDRWLPTKLERQLALFHGDPELGVSCTRRHLMDAQGRRLAYRQPDLHRGKVLPQLFRQNFVCFSSVMVQRLVFDAVGQFDESLALAIDYDLWLRAARLFRFDYVDETLVDYRVGHASLSRRQTERLQTVAEIMQRFLDQHGGRELLDPAVVREAWVETYCHLGLAQRGLSLRLAAGAYAQALRLDPGCREAWKGLASLALPEGLRRPLRLVLGRPADWTVRPTVASLQP